MQDDQTMNDQGQGMPAGQQMPTDQPQGDQGGMPAQDPMTPPVDQGGETPPAEGGEETPTMPGQGGQTGM